VSCERVFSIAGGFIPPRPLLGDGRFDEHIFLKGYFKNFGGVEVYFVSYNNLKRNRTNVQKNLIFI